MAGTFLCVARLQYEDTLTDSFPALDAGAHVTTCTVLYSFHGAIFSVAVCTVVALSGKDSALQLHELHNLVWASNSKHELFRL
jgi:hypothetical protein